MTIHSIFFATSRAIPMNKTDLIIHYLKRDLSPTDEHDFKAEYFTIAPIVTSLDFKVMPLVSQVWNNSIYFDWRDLRVWIGHGQVRRILFTSNCKHFLWYLPPTGDANTVGSDKNVWSSCFKRINWKTNHCPRQRDVPCLQQTNQAYYAMRNSRYLIYIYFLLLDWTALFFNLLNFF